MSTLDPFTASSWRPLEPARARTLTDARAQLHHCVQFVSGFGISYLPHAVDDSHTSMRWDATREALVSASHEGVAVALRLADLTLLVSRGEGMDVVLAAHGASMAILEARLRAALSGAGLDADRYTLQRHFEIPAHPVASGAHFDVSDADSFEALAAWYANAAMVLERTAVEHSGSPVRCWPHHFDIATLVTVAPGRTTGAGLSPGDHYYDEPYFYVNAYPSPAREALPPVTGGGGHWHTDEWIGAVLPGSELAGVVAAQREQTEEFLRSSLDALRALVRGAPRA